MLTRLMLLACSAHAGDYVATTPVAGLTSAQVANATSTIAVATYVHDGKTAELRCMGAGATLSCEVRGQADQSLIAASSTVQFCRFGDSIAITSEKLGGRRLTSPADAINNADSHEYRACK